MTLLKEATPRKRFLLVLPLLATLAVENPFALAAWVGYSVADITGAQPRGHMPVCLDHAIMQHAQNNSPGRTP